MKNLTLTTLTLLIAASTFGQKLKEYTASNGVTYSIGDTVKLGRGSAPNGDFLYLQMGGWAAAASYDSNQGSDQLNIGRNYAGLAVTIKKIRKYKFKGQEKVYFTVGGGNITNYNLIIEDAIATCEVADCNDGTEDQNSEQPDKYERLKKLKELLDEGVITQEEFDAEKKKILEGN